MPSIQDNWPFDDPPNMAVITTRQVIREGAPIAFVFHDEDDGGWQFLAAGPLIDEDARVVGLGEIWKRDPSVGELADLPLGWQAWRGTARDAWHRGPRDREKNEPA